MSEIGDSRAIVMLLDQLGLSIRHKFNLALEDNGLRMRQLLALRELESGPVGQQALAAALNMDPTKLVGLLNELEVAGLVDRTRDLGDRRRHIVTITERGLASLADATRACQIFEDNVVGGLAADERKRLHEALATIGEALDAG